MGFRGFIASLGIVLALVGCGGEGGQQEPAGSGGKSSCGGCGDKPPPTRTNPIGWDESTPFGVTPAEAFGAVAGSCSASLKWEYASEGNFSIVEPPAGSTDVTVTVAFDEASASFEDCAAASFQCNRSITAEAQLTVASADGAFADEGSVHVTYVPGGAVSQFDLRVLADDLGGTLTVSSNEKDSESSLTYRVLAMGSACQGEISLGLFIPHEDGRGGIGFDGQLGSWSGK